MSDGTRLATFVHISDLHFGSIDPNSGQVVYDAYAPSMWGRCSWFDGLLGHHYLALVQLRKVFDQIRRAENAGLIVTGDLTSTGAPDQFDTAADYLISQLVPPRGNYVGLFVQRWRDLAIPGNHD